MTRKVLALFIVLPLLAAALLANPAQAAGPCTGSAVPAKWDHIIWIWFENHTHVVGTSAAPYFTSLANQCGYASNYHGVTHPSLPNYLAATGGSTFGVTDDEAPAAHPINADSIFGQVRSVLNRRWRSYQESMPVNCDLEYLSGYYAVKHNPAAYFTPIRTQCRTDDVPSGTTTSGALLTDLANDATGAFAFVTPNQCSDMHDCSVATGNAWLQAWMGKILASRQWSLGRTAVFVTFDEDDRNHGNVVDMIVVAPSVVAGTRTGTSFTHYSLLRTSEEMLRLPLLGNAASAASMRSAFHL